MFCLRVRAFFRVRTTFSLPSPWLALSLGLGLVLGCAHTDSAADRHIDEMRATIGDVQAEQDRTSRRFETTSAKEEPGPSAARAPGTKAAPGGGAGAVRSVQIGDGDEAGESDDPNDPNARPEIRLQGTPGAASRPSSRTRSSRRDAARIDPADDRPPSSGGAAEGRPSIMDPEAKRAYEAALAQVNGKQYERALESFAAFLVRWPDHPYVENALYWRGEAYFARGEYLRAAEQFEGVLAKFGGGNKAPDALLKIGLCHDKLGADARAREYWERLRTDFPRSDAARRIPNNTRSAGPKESR
jgi:tol-pal system protein YbgF